MYNSEAPQALLCFGWNLENKIARYIKRHEHGALRIGRLWRILENTFIDRFGRE